MKELGRNPAGSKIYRSGTYWSREEDQIIKDAVYTPGLGTKRYNSYSLVRKLKEAGFERSRAAIRRRIWKLGNYDFNLDRVLYYSALINKSGENNEEGS